MFETEAERQTAERLVGGYVAFQKKAARERPRLQRALEEVRRLQHAANQAGHAAEVQQWHLQIRLLETYLRQLNHYAPASDVFPVPDAAALAWGEWEGLVAQRFQLEFDLANMQRIRSFLQRALPAAHNGQTLPASCPPGWSIWQPKLTGSSELSAQFTRFEHDVDSLAQRIAEFAAAFDALEAQPFPQRLAAAKALPLPALRGEVYRLESLFRRLPDGDAFLAALRLTFEEPLSNARFDAPARSVPEATEKRNLTDRLKDFFKGKP